MVNTVKSEENIEKIGKNYTLFDINDDGTTNNNKSDLIMRDDNTVYVKYANQNNIYEDANYDTDYYVYND